MTRLSVIIPCLNRHDMVRACISSIISASRSAEVEVVLVDDGSNPSLAPGLVDLIRSQDLVIAQENMGRASALRVGILASTSEYMMIMDSDDEMIANEIDNILGDIDRLDRRYVGLVYEAVDFDGGEIIGRLPDVEGATLLELRADFGVKGDLKEVVKVDTVRSVLYADPLPERRVPTSFLWAGVSSLGRVKVVRRPVVRHRYLAGGMTRSIGRLKKENPKWLSATYLRIALAPGAAYKSRRFRFSYALRAEATWPEGLPSNERAAIRQRLGWALGSLARFGGCLLRLRG